MKCDASRCDLLASEHRDYQSPITGRLERLHFCEGHARQWDEEHQGGTPPERIEHHEPQYHRP